MVGLTRLRVAEDEEEEEEEEGGGGVGGEEEEEEKEEEARRRRRRRRKHTSMLRYTYIVLLQFNLRVYIITTGYMILMS
jgi:hypothetical protein